VSFELGARIVAAGDGSFVVRLPPEERELLLDLRAQLRDLLLGRGDDPAITRLFPPAFAPDEKERNEEYRQLMHDDLLAQRLDALDVMESSIDAKSLNEEQVAAWLGSLNDLRLVLGTRLEITEDDIEEPPLDDPRSAGFALYYYLSWLVEQIVEALSGGV
jgi:hypothetical protein